MINKAVFSLANNYSNRNEEVNPRTGALRFNINPPTLNGPLGEYITPSIFYSQNNLLYPAGIPTDKQEPSFLGLPPGWRYYYSFIDLVNTETFDSSAGHKGRIFINGLRSYHMKQGKLLQTDLEGINYELFGLPKYDYSNRKSSITRCDIEDYSLKDMTLNLIHEINYMSNVYGYLLKFYDGTEQYFDSYGKLRTIIDRFGNTATIKYVSESASVYMNKIAKIETSFGNEVIFNYDKDQHAINIDYLPDNKNIKKESFQYRTDANEKYMTEYIDPTGAHTVFDAYHGGKLRNDLLSSVKYPNGLVVDYDYTTLEYDSNNTTVDTTYQDLKVKGDAASPQLKVDAVSKISYRSTDKSVETRDTKYAYSLGKNYMYGYDTLPQDKSRIKYLAQQLSSTTYNTKITNYDGSVVNYEYDLLHLNRSITRTSAADDAQRLSPAKEHSSGFVERLSMKISSDQYGNITSTKYYMSDQKEKVINKCISETKTEYFGLEKFLQIKSQETTSYFLSGNPTTAKIVNTLSGDGKNIAETQQGPVVLRKQGSDITSDFQPTKKINYQYKDEEWAKGLLDTVTTTFINNSSTTDTKDADSTAVAVYDPKNVNPTAVAVYDPKHLPAVESHLSDLMSKLSNIPTLQRSKVEEIISYSYSSQDDCITTKIIHTTKAADQSNSTTSVITRDLVTRRILAQEGPYRQLVEPLPLTNRNLTKYEYGAKENKITILKLLDPNAKNEDKMYKKTYIQYDPQSNKTSISSSTSKKSIIYYHDVFGNLTKIACKIGNKKEDTQATYKYDRLGRVVEELRTDGFFKLSKKYTYDSHNSITSVTDASGNETKYEYNYDTGTVKTIHNGVEVKALPINNSAVKTSYSYDAARNLSCVETSNKDDTHVKCTLHDLFGNPAISAAFSGLTKDFTQNDKKDYTEVKPAISSVFKYDLFGDVTSEKIISSEQSSTQLATEYIYDIFGRLQIFKDFSGNKFTYSYDEQQRITSEISSDIVGGLYKKVFTYDANNLLSIESPELPCNIKEKSCDSFGSQSSNKVSYTYNDDDSLASVKYSQENRENNVVYSWDKGNGVLKTQDNRGIWINEHDSSGLITGCYRYYNNDDKVIRYMGTVEYYTKDDMSCHTGKVKSIRTLYVPENSKYYSSYTREYKYDDYGRLHSIKIKNDMPTIPDSQQEKMSFHYQYNEENGNIASLLSKNSRMLKSVTYKYDPWNRLIAHTSMKDYTRFTRDTHYIYDAANNVIEENIEGRHKACYTYDGMNKLTSIDIGLKVMNHSELKYDTAGNLTQDDYGNKYFYNIQNQLIKYVSSNGKQVTYTYYPDGLRASKRSDGQPIYFFYDSQGNIIREEQGTLSTTYLMINGRRYMGITTDSALSGYEKVQHYFWNHKDIAACYSCEIPQKTSNDHKVSMDYYDTDPYGVDDSSSNHHNPFRYGGEYHDDESGLIYLRSRYYSPRLKRFITRDTYPLFNRYTYCDGDPVNYVDPWGHARSITIIMDDIKRRRVELGINLPETSLTTTMREQLMTLGSELAQALEPLGFTVLGNNYLYRLPNLIDDILVNDRNDAPNIQDMQNILSGVRATAAHDIRALYASRNNAPPVFLLDYDNQTIFLHLFYKLVMRYLYMRLVGAGSYYLAGVAPSQRPYLDGDSGLLGIVLGFDQFMNISIYAFFSTVYSVMLYCLINIHTIYGFHELLFFILGLVDMAFRGISSSPNSRMRQVVTNFLENSGSPIISDRWYTNVPEILSLLFQTTNSVFSYDLPRKVINRLRAPNTPEAERSTSLWYHSIFSFCVFSVLIGFGYFTSSSISSRKH